MVICYDLFFQKQSYDMGLPPRRQRKEEKTMNPRNDPQRKETNNRQDLRHCMNINDLPIASR